MFCHVDITELTRPIMITCGGHHFLALLQPPRRQGPPCGVCSHASLAGQIPKGQVTEGTSRCRLNVLIIITGEGESEHSQWTAPLPDLVVAGLQLHGCRESISSQIWRQKSCLCAGVFSGWLTCASAPLEGLCPLNTDSSVLRFVSQPSFRK